MSILYIILSLLLWGVIHSLLASNTFKAWLTNLLGKSLMRGYRLFYNVFSLASFLPILYLAATLPDAPLYSVPAPISYLMFLGQGLAAILLLVGIFQTDTLSFIGLRPLFEEEKPAQFVTSGLYRLVRHPLYTAGLLFLWLSPQVTVNSFTLYVGATIYILIGAYYEERKLLREFGAAYAEYKSKTPILFPLPKKNRV
jgi:protein-S-isoprenylcysteine O-methyltransferase Ste14